MEQLCLSLKNANVRGYNHRWSVIVNLCSKLKSLTTTIDAPTMDKLLLFEDELSDWIDAKMSHEEVVEDTDVIDQLIAAKSAREHGNIRIYVQHMRNILEYLHRLGNN